MKGSDSEEGGPKWIIYPLDLLINSNSGSYCLFSNRRQYLSTALETQCHKKSDGRVQAPTRKTGKHNVSKCYYCKNLNQTKK